VTERLYYDDPSIVEFDAAVLRIESRGDRVGVWLDRTSFYPTSGGQPFDTGTLAACRVVEVEEDQAGDVVHLLEAPGPIAAGERLRGRVDWTRRFDHMQQHTGQHVLSSAIVRLFNVPTVSFHMGSDHSTIDLKNELTPAQIAAAEDEANRIVWEDRRVRIRYVTAEEAATLPLRREPVRTGLLRLVEVEGFDLSACGGTHVARTGAIGVVGITAWERFKGGQRLEFLCGGRVVSWLRALRETTAHATRLLSVLPSEIPAAVERAQQETRDQQRAIAALERDLTRYRARELAQQAETLSAGHVVLAAVNADAGALKAIASAITAAPGFVVVLISQTMPALVVAARSSDRAAISCQTIVAGLAAQFDGRGGGKPDLAQGGGLTGSAEAILAAARMLVQP
jgi:alanyl-tRNA synthetase